MPLLSGHRALVCGSSQGIGLACAIELSLEGAACTLVARSEPALQRALTQLAPVTGQEHRYLAVDFANPAAVQAAVEADVAAHGPYQVLINNTGGPPAGPVFDAKPEQFIDAITRHVLCNQVLAQALVPAMKQARYGRIVNIISTSVKQPIPGLGVSNTTRGAVASWAKTLAGELAPFGITVNNVLPGMTETERLRELIRIKAEKAGVGVADMERAMIAEIPAGRFAKPAEIAAAVAFLASPAASYVTGINLPVDGGRTGSL